MIDQASNPFLAGVEIPPPDPRVEHLAHAREVKQGRSEDRRRGLIERAREARLDEEKRRVADYCIKQIEGPRQDVGHLRGRLEEIMREHERSRRA